MDLAKVHLDVAHRLLELVANSRLRTAAWSARGALLLWVLGSRPASFG
ncbi:MAG: hypothetical protein P8R42_21725 [Candidatus Binatia bacterium]|nr:hypothetical protein [Candidatus Binatia bacterium]